MWFLVVMLSTLSGGPSETLLLTTEFPFRTLEACTKEAEKREVETLTDTYLREALIEKNVKTHGYTCVPDSI